MHYSRDGRAGILNVKVGPCPTRPAPRYASGSYAELSVKMSQPGRGGYVTVTPLSATFQVGCHFYALVNGTFAQ